VGVEVVVAAGPRLDEDLETLFDEPLYGLVEPLPSQPEIIVTRTGSRCYGRRDAPLPTRPLFVTRMLRSRSMFILEEFKARLEKGGEAR
jgi:hypothetical protein